MGQLAAVETQVNAAQIVAQDSSSGLDSSRSSNSNSLSTSYVAPLSTELRRKVLAFCKAAHKRLSVYITRLDFDDNVSSANAASSPRSGTNIGGKSAARPRAASPMSDSDDEDVSVGRTGVAASAQGFAGNSGAAKGNGNGGIGGGFDSDSDDDKRPLPASKRPRASQSGGSDWADSRKGNVATAKPLSSQVCLAKANYFIATPTCILLMFSR